jgi:uncharacterized protein (TIGR02145 family)
MKNILILVLGFLGCAVNAQLNMPGIPYQAVVREVDGTAMSDTNVEVRFTLRNLDALNGVVVYQEQHALTTNNQGLMHATIGEGVVLNGNFQTIDWSILPKFLQVEFRQTGLGEYLEMGNQQLMSVPCALYSSGTKLRVSNTGDTLTIGNAHLIVPGVSVANFPVQNANGSMLLPTVESCDSINISISGCDGENSISYFNETYSIVEIGGQCWFANNLNSSYFRNGDLIPSGLFDSQWVNAGPAYSDYNNIASNSAVYGKLYNGLSIIDERGICPTGWHVPSDCDWMYLENNCGMSSVDLDTAALNSNYSRGDFQNVGGKLRSQSGWIAFNGITNTNDFGFSALPGGYRNSGGSYGNLGINGYWWTSTPITNNILWVRRINPFDRGLNRGGFDYYQAGFSVRCIKD